MNTITPISSNFNLKNKPQAPETQPQTPAFKGAIGDKVVKQIVNREAVTVASILALVGGMIGLNKDKVADVMESFVDKIKGLSAENTSLVNQKANLEKQNLDAQKEIEKVRQEGVSLLENANRIISKKDVIIDGQKARIEELEKYEAMAKVKSVDEIDTVMPEEFISTLEAIKENNSAARNSLFNYVMTGKGQEAFLAQLERNEILLKGREDGIDNIPEVKEALEKTAKEAAVGSIGYSSYYVACRMLRDVLLIQPEASYIQSQAIYAQVKENAEALINQFLEKGYTYSDSVEKSMQYALKFQKDIAEMTKLAGPKHRYEFVGDTIDTNSINGSYRTFKDTEGNFVDYSFSSLAAGFWGECRKRTPEGKVLFDNSRIK